MHLSCKGVEYLSMWSHPPCTHSDDAVSDSTKKGESCKRENKCSYKHLHLINNTFKNVFTILLQVLLFPNHPIAGDALPSASQSPL